MNIEVKAPETETWVLRTIEPHPVSALSGIYLDCGLPLDLAAKNVIADCRLFEEEILPAC